MWVLEKNGTPERVHYLPCGPALMVSRRESHILLQGDNSISRHHARIIINHSVDNLKYSRNWPEVKVYDLGAKYGTYVNEGIERNEKIQGQRILVDGDRIRFGLLENLWRLKYRALVTTTSALTTESKGQLQIVLVELGGHLLVEWSSSCSYLVMNNITLTIKVVCALAAARHIVRPDFFSTMLDAVMRKIDHPEPSQFSPPLKEMSISQSLADFSPDERRKQVLSGLNFIFPSAKQMKRMGLAVTLAGGNALLLSEENYRSVASTNYILVQVPPEKNQDPSKSQLFKAAKEILKEKDLRVIPEADIGLAILFVSTESHCNPAFTMANLLKRNGSSSMTQSEGVQIYATETQDLNESSVSLTGTRVVPESGVSNSRRTPATLPDPSFPLSNSGMNSSSASTNASVLVPIDNDLPSRSDLEDKENVMQGLHKRTRSYSGSASLEPKSKRSNRTPDNEAFQPEVEPTQPMENQSDDEEDMSQDCAQVNELAVSKFEPQHVSTQRNDASNDRTVVNEVKSPSKRPGDGTDSPDVSGDAAVIPSGGRGGPSLEPTVGRSIPFEPYTLPSLNVDPYREDDVVTQPFANIKQEPASLPLDEPDCYSGKRRREEELDLLEEEGTSEWFGKKKTRTDNTSNVQIKRERSSISHDRTPNPRPVKQELPNHDDFSLSSVSERSRRRAEQKRKLEGEGTTSKAEEDLFELPISSRAERRRKLMKTEEESSRKTDRRSVVKEAAVAQRDHQIATTSNNIKNTSVNESRYTDISSNGIWISKKSEGCATGAANSPVKAEAIVSNVASKSEPKYGDVAELTGALEKSLVVVEVASLIRRREKNPVSASNPQNISVGSLKNFKNFKKCASDIMSLPKIIGGRDLVAHDVAERREGWARDNPDVTSLFEDRQVRGRTNDDELDNLFDLPQNPRSRPRVKR